MENNKPKLLLSRPKDESFGAFKEWIKDMASHLGIAGEADEEKLRKGWEKFWGK
ncbi:MAG: hypothetical protein HQ579_02785 [Candidatus Omnitrophica bacterium]|nr:hypothetical protein [Candidatus Omnitrophota bacterium]